MHVCICVKTKYPFYLIAAVPQVLHYFGNATSCRADEDHSWICTHKVRNPKQRKLRCNGHTCVSNVFLFLCFAHHGRVLCDVFVNFLFVFVFSPEACKGQYSAAYTKGRQLRGHSVRVTANF
jgi:hypothetical protein